ncbi:MAG: ROK family protein [Vicinamibacteraceae bacterium]
MPSPVARDRQSHARIGLDIGGTKMAGGLVLFPDGHVLARRVIPTRPDRSGNELLRDTLALTTDLIAVAASKGCVVEGIGAGVAELVARDGEITSAQTIPWLGLPVRERLSELAPAVVESDVRAAAIGEAAYGAGRGHEAFVYVTVGTGISCSLVQRGEPFGGAHGNALVLASGPTSHTCPHCGERSTMILEELASGPAIARRYAARAGRNGITAEDVMRAADADDPIALDVVASAGTALGAAVGFLVNVLDPHAIVVGGGLGCSGGRYWHHLVESARAHVWADASRGVPIVRAALGQDAGIVGAAVASCRHAPPLPKENR